MFNLYSLKNKLLFQQDDQAETPDLKNLDLPLIVSCKSSQDLKETIL